MSKKNLDEIYKNAYNKYIDIYKHSGKARYAALDIVYKEGDFKYEKR